MSESTEAPPRGREASMSRGTTTVPGGATAAPTKTEQLVITRNVPGGEIVNFEFINASGQRAEIPEDQIRGIAGQDEIGEIASALDEAFDAGVNVLLEETLDDDEGDVSDGEQLALVRLLLIPLVGRRTVRRIKNLRTRLFHQLILRRLVRRYALANRIATS